MKRVTTAFIITFIVYLVILSAIYYMTTLEYNTATPKSEQRIKIELKDLPKKMKKKSGTKKVIKKIKKDIAPPMPKGKQLKKRKKEIKKEIAKKIKKTAPKKVIQKQVTKKKEIIKKEVVKKSISKENKVIPSSITPKPIKKVVQKSDINQTKPEKQKKSLYSFLSKKVVAKKVKKNYNSQRASKINSDIKELYGDDFGKLSEGEQKYILNNQEIMRRITQEVLNRVGSVNIPQNLRVNKHNLVEFYLYPNGDISDITFIERTGFYLLDDTTKETIEYAYAKYPRPKQKTLIRYKVGYYLQGY